MGFYLVTWEIEIEADTPLHAARLARAEQRKDSVWNQVFTVSDGRTVDKIDLEEHQDAV